METGRLMREEPITVRCLVCGSHSQVERAHWPYAVGMGRSRKKVELPTLPICVRCHEFGQHLGDEEITRKLIDRAPAYWQEMDEWEFARPYYERFVARLEYLEAVR
jgi:hypothetical protein